MSEETTEDMSRKYATRTTIETVLERIDVQSKEMLTGFAAVENLFNKEAVRPDRIESEVNLAHSEFYELRADFRELHDALKEHFPAVK
ncbi:MAG: hypothetical protein M3458_07845 [Acidobacteriota bacterium]|nr:hypothetical protein [Acidobacteriota bacterium]